MNRGVMVTRGKPNENELVLSAGYDVVKLNSHCHFKHFIKLHLLVYLNTSICSTTVKENLVANLLYILKVLHDSVFGFFAEEYVQLKKVINTEID